MFKVDKWLQDLKQKNKPMIYIPKETRYISCTKLIIKSVTRCAAKIKKLDLWLYGCHLLPVPIDSFLPQSHGVVPISHRQDVSSQRP